MSSMAGGLRLGFGYTFLVLGIVLLLVGAVLAGVSFEASGEGQDCEGGGPLDDGDCEQGSGSVSFDGAGGVTLLPGVVLLLVAAPLIVFGHKARSEAHRHPPHEDAGAPEEDHEPNG